MKCYDVEFNTLFDKFNTSVDLSEILHKVALYLDYPQNINIFISLFDQVFFCKRKRTFAFECTGFNSSEKQSKTTIYMEKFVCLSNSMLSFQVSCVYLVS